MRPLREPVLFIPVLQIVLLILELKSVTSLDLLVIIWFCHNASLRLKKSGLSVAISVHFPTTVIDVVDGLWSRDSARERPSATSNGHRSAV